MILLVEKINHTSKCYGCNFIYPKYFSNNMFHSNQFHSETSNHSDAFNHSALNHFFLSNSPLVVIFFGLVVGDTFGYPVCFSCRGYFGLFRLVRILWFILFGKRYFELSIWSGYFGLSGLLRVYVYCCLKMCFRLLLNVFFINYLLVLLYCY